MRAAGAIAPTATGRFAFRLFCTPPRRATLTAGEARMAQRMAPLIERAEHRMVGFDGGRVAAWSWRAPEHPVRGRILLVHGWSGRALVMTAFVEPLLKAGFDVVALDLPGHGASDGRRLSLPLGARAVQAVAAAHGGITGVVAHSFGGPVSMLAAEGGPPLSGPMPLARIVLIASPNSMATVTRRFSDRVGLTERTRSVLEAEILRVAERPAAAFVVGEFLARLGRPALVIHDTGDLDVPFVRAEEIVAAAPQTTRLVATSGIGHRRIVVAPQAIKAAVRFLAEPAPSS
jgi:pimeloyl-ACP methyl ester carboxylesterase